MAARAKAPDPDPDPEPLAHDDRVDRGVEHLQAAAHEVLAAARSFLDVVEDIVSDRDKLSSVATSVSDAVAGAGGSLARLADRVTGTGGGEPSAEPPKRAPRVRRIDVD